MDKRVADLSRKKGEQETSHHFVQAMAAAAFGVSIITTAGKAGRFGLTVSAVTSVSAQPPLLLACVNRKNMAEQAITQNRSFAVNFLADDQSHLAKIFAGRPDHGAAPYDFAQGTWHESDSGLPLLDGATASLVCDLETYYDAGTHRIFIGHVISAHHSAARPLVYSHRKFGRFTMLD
jgi:flavin reductase (DIM6/NTAB) family NADH-FMN oxidoreductase RutF